MFSANTHRMVICLLAMLHMSDGKNGDAHVLPLTKKDRLEIVKAHNDVRRKVEPPAADMYKMVWHKEAEVNAKNYAAICSEHHSDYDFRVIKNPKLNCGENLFFTYTKTSWADVIKEWASEGKDFEYGKGGNGRVVGHYTQVVWWNSMHIACGAAKCDNLVFPYLYVCHYCPAGNDWERLFYPYTSSDKRCSSCPGRCEKGLCVY